MFETINQTFQACDLPQAAELHPCPHHKELRASASCRRNSAHIVASLQYSWLIQARWLAQPLVVMRNADL